MISTVYYTAGLPELYLQFETAEGAKAAEKRLPPSMHCSIPKFVTPEGIALCDSHYWINRNHAAPKNIPPERVIGLVAYGRGNPIEAVQVMISLIGAYFKAPISLEDCQCIQSHQIVRRSKL